MTEDGCLGDRGKDEEGLLGVWDTSDGGYFVQVLGAKCFPSNDNWTAAEQNLQRAQKIFVRLAKIFGREGSDRRTAGRFYVAVVQVVLLFGSETWVLTPWLEKP